MLAAVGDIVEDVVVLLAGPPAPGSDVDAVVSRHRGGSAANTAVAAARRGRPARFIGQVGDDVLGDLLLDRLRRDGVEPAVVRGGRTGTIVVLVEPGGERTMLRDRGASPDLATVDPAWLDDVTVLHVPAYSLLGGALAATAAGLIAAARDRGIVVSVDPSSTTELATFGVERFRALLTDLRPDVLLPNAAEADVLGIGGRPPDGVGMVVVKAGADPARVIAPGGTVEVAVPHPAAAVDTTGAGDAFAAGFLLAHADGLPVEQAVRAGHDAAADVVNSPGATPTEEPW